MEVGVRIVRGPDWNWGNQDGGEGHAGTVVEIGHEGSPTTPAGTVVIQWDMGTRTNYRTSYEGAYDLLMYDNAQIGIRHPNIICDGCKKLGVMGLRWQCSVCFEFDLCSQCYMENKHDLNHAFSRYDTAHSFPELVSARAGLDRTELRGIFQGATVLRGTDWDWGNQDGHPNTMERHESSGGGVLGDRVLRVGDTVQCQLDHDVLKQMQNGHGGWNPKMAEFVGRVGTVHRLTERGDVRVQYSNGVRWTFHPGAITKVETIPVGEVVQLSHDEEKVQRLQVGHGEWTENMKSALGKFGTVVQVYSDGDLRVRIGDQIWTLNPLCIILLSSCKHDCNFMSPDCQPVNLVPSPSLLSIMEESGRDECVVSLAARGNLQRLQNILKLHPKKVDAVNQGHTALHMAAALGHKDILSFLLTAGAELAISDAEGNTALHLASMRNQCEAIELLLSAGAAVEAQNLAGGNAMHYVASLEHVGALRTLCHFGANPNAQDQKGNTPLHLAISRKRSESITALLELPSLDLSCKNRHGFNLLHHASLKGCLIAVQGILGRARQLVNVQKDDGYSSLHLAVLNNHCAVVEVLLAEDHSDLNLQTCAKKTPLHLAASEGHTSMVQLLVMAGADLNVQDESGDTSLHLAVAPWNFRANMTPGASGSTRSDRRTGPCDEAIMEELRSSGLLDGFDPPVPIAVALCFALHGADITLKNRQGQVVTDLIQEPRAVQLLLNCARRHQEPSPASTLTSNTSGTDDARNEIDSNEAPPQPEECVVCNELTSLILFLPCNHRIGCEDCTKRMRKCITCQLPIEKKIRFDSTELETSFPLSPLPSPLASNVPTEVHQVTAQMHHASLDDRYTCSLCMERQLNTVFMCGHATCSECSEDLRLCPLCRKPIEKKIRMYM
uniref:E3 ubiquitin-protein ligase MIB2 isoform X2 n=1 Tax=Myxine glutinosa TaxID=7769 RepID=UPI00358FD0BB